jgi:DNA-binding MurR/RpiR family transcriptional regulator
MPRDAYSIAQRIARAELSPSHRQIADYVLQHPLRVAAMRVEELADIVGVSVPTANRFARALSFEGYAQFRAALVLGFEAALAPVEKLRGTPDTLDSVGEVFAATLGDVARNAEFTRKGFVEHDGLRAVEAILGARRVFVLGYGSSAWLTGLLVRRLELFCADVRSLVSVEGPSFGGKTLRNAGPDDVVVVTAFPRYLSDSVLLAHRAREMGARILVLTDGPHSPLAAIADIVLYAATDSRYFANCEASVLALVEALTAAVAHASGRSMEAASLLAEAVLPWLHDNHSVHHRRAPRAAYEPGNAVRKSKAAAAGIGRSQPAGRGQKR